GVAPDHQSIKGVYRRYEKTSLLPNVRFLGNVEVGTHVSLDELRSLYDAVVLAVGAPADRALGIPGDTKKGVIGSAAFVGWYNSHPEFADLNPDLDAKSVVVIGNGNVAVDVARVLAKTPAEMAESDLAPYAAEKIHASPIASIWMVGRRGPLEAKFTPKELGELGELQGAVALAKTDQLPKLAVEERAALDPATRKNLEHLESFASRAAESGKKTLHMEFFAMPVEILGGEKVEAMRFERTRVEDGKCIGTGERFDIPCQLVFPCIGYKSAPIAGVPFDERAGHFVNQEGVVAEGLYATGWARRGPTGTIGTNRPDGQGIAGKILGASKPSAKPGGAGLDALLKGRGVSPVTFTDWKNIEAAEEKAASAPHPRVKFHRIPDLLKAAKG
ncbi:MAG TPA: FAD-dependent oxidoreductase, partial [Sphingomonadales bacterium]|nr:FAD-dependent oxidoreductase [Sphingomonadales bacterium]